MRARGFWFDAPRACVPVSLDRPRNTLGMLADLGVEGLRVYEEDFEAPFLEATKDFYKAESLDFLASNTCPDYLAKAQARLGEEQARVRHYLNPSTDSKLKRVVEVELISNHARVLVEMEASGCVFMLEHDRVADLRRMYDLLARVPTTLDFLRNCVCDHVKKVGMELVSDQEKVRDPVAFARRLLELRDKYDVVLVEAFKSEKKFQKRLKDAFEEFINADSRCASYLVHYIDELLRSALKGLSEAEADAQLEKVVVIFRYLQDKDVFENFYKQYLAKRLLGGKSLSEDSERSMIAKLKTECGYQFTSKLEGMFTDMAMSKETMAQFAAYHTEALRIEAERSQAEGATEGADSAGGSQPATAPSAAPSEASGPLSTRLGDVELEVTMLTMAHWPASPHPPCKLPPQIIPAHGAFKDFYLRKHTGRKLSWQTGLGTADLKAHFGRGGPSGWVRHDLNVSTYQMCILMRFNACGAEAVPYEALKELGIPAQELSRHLISLCTPKHRILHKASKGKNISETDSFTFNPDYTSKLKRIKVPLVSAKEAAVFVTELAVPPAVEEDRRHLVEAAIVRIMKTRKVLQHNELIAEATRQLTHRFLPTPAFIKKRVESLIEREYLERDKDDRRLYTYLA
mmetsp:Transcript_33794/g.76419  ORF Transcript_33794/g.76419 Transcript_33794/m.76419 type:complete len:630 (-) Transcript_33794:160-2049(-)